LLIIFLIYIYIYIYIYDKVNKIYNSLLLFSLFFFCNTYFVALIFPSYIAQNWLAPNQNLMTVVSEYNCSSYPCRVYRANRNSDEKYVGRRWYAFVKEKKLRRGEIWILIVTNPSNHLIVRTFYLSYKLCVYKIAFFIC
jgi:hypothetical protein